MLALGIIALVGAALTFAQVSFFSKLHTVRDGSLIAGGDLVASIGSICLPPKRQPLEAAADAATLAELALGEVPVPPEAVLDIQRYWRTIGSEQSNENVTAFNGSQTYVFSLKSAPGLIFKIPRHDPKKGILECSTWNTHAWFAQVVS